MESKSMDGISSGEKGQCEVVSSSDSGGKCVKEEGLNKIRVPLDGDAITSSTTLLPSSDHVETRSSEDGPADGEVEDDDLGKNAQHGGDASGGGGGGGGKARETFKMPLSFSLRSPKLKPISPQSDLENLTVSPVSNNKSAAIDDKRSVQVPVITGTSGDQPQPETAEPVAIPPKVHSKCPQLPYQEPSWSGLPDVAYSFEILKSGVIVNTVDLSDKTFHVIGKVATCDVVMEHPSISRYHAVVQYRAIEGAAHPAGFYVYDLDSSNGTFLNKLQLKSCCYYRLHVGHVLKFGGSTKMFILQGPDDDQEEESPLSVTELKELRKMQEEKLRLIELEEEEQEEEKQQALESAGIDWGMGDDAEEESEEASENPFAVTANEDLYIDDPKKTLRGWFEREGYELEYKVEERGGHSQFLCRIELPLDTPSGEPLYAEASVKGKKKEAVIACALEACRILDRQGLLRQANHESRKRKQKNWEDEDYYESDEDTFLDRTGSIEKKRQQRIQKFTKTKEVETFDTLMAKFEKITKEAERIEAAIRLTNKSDSLSGNVDDDIDALDAYMSSISNEAVVDKQRRTTLKIQLSQLRQEEMKLKRLINIAKPATLPELKKAEPRQSTTEKSKFAILNAVKKKLPDIKFGPALQPDAQLNMPKFTSKDDEYDTDEDIADKEHAKTDDGKIKSSAETSKSKDLQEPLKITNEQRGKLDVPESSSESKQKIELKMPAMSDSEEIKRKSDSQSKANKRKRSEKKYEYDASNPDYAMWMPPQNQSGDGRTSLNDKYGY